MYKAYKSRTEEACTFCLAQAIAKGDITKSIKLLKSGSIFNGNFAIPIADLNNFFIQQAKKGRNDETKQFVNLMLEQNDPADFSSDEEEEEESDRKIPEDKEEEYRFISSEIVFQYLAQSAVVNTCEHLRVNSSLVCTTGMHAFVVNNVVSIAMLCKDTIILQEVCQNSTLSMENACEMFYSPGTMPNWMRTQIVPGPIKLKFLGKKCQSPIIPLLFAWRPELHLKTLLENGKINLNL